MITHIARKVSFYATRIRFIKFYNSNLMPSAALGTTYLQKYVLGMHLRNN